MEWDDQTRRAVQAVREQLFALQDPVYRDFQCRLMPTVDPAAVIGVRMPALRRLARSLRGCEEARLFLCALPHTYYDENNLHGLLLCEIGDYGETVRELERFLPHVDNWATCDLLAPRAFRALPPQLPERLRAWTRSEHPYTVRFGLCALMRHYVEQSFLPDALVWAAQTEGGPYYVDMMLAWFFATALTVRWDDALPYLAQRRLSPWVHNKAIQKAIESRRVPPERKQALRALRIPGVRREEDAVF